MELERLEREKIRGFLENVVGVQVFAPLPPLHHFSVIDFHFCLSRTHRDLKVNPPVPDPTLKLHLRIKESPNDD